MSDTATLAFEIGTEEIPAFDLKRATEQLAELVPAALDAVRIPHGEVAIYTSPRRLIAIVADVAARTEALEEVFRGPAAKIAFDEAGNPTKAAIGFARGKGKGDMFKNRALAVGKADIGDFQTVFHACILWFIIFLS